MVLLALASFLLVFITYFTGVAGMRLLNRLTGLHLAAGLFDTFLTGLVTCFTWFNLFSFVAPVNYLSLLPLLLVSLFFFLQPATRQLFFGDSAAVLRLFFSRPNSYFTLAFLVLFFIYWIIPPANPDSAIYHYTSILWYEKYKVVPGLANIHGRLAFNPASFIISAPWSFTDFAGQSIYPLNGVLALLFYGWLVKKIILAKNSLASVALLLCGVLLFRNTLSNISSPSSDLLSTLLVFYTGFRIYENIREEKKDFGDFMLPALFLVFAITAKLSTLPLAVLFVYVFFFFLRDKNKYRLLLKASLPLLLVIIPWLARNIVMCGSLAYPFPHTDFFHTDWATPQDMFKLEFIISKYYPRMYAESLAYTTREQFPGWLGGWLSSTFHHAPYTFFLYCAAFLSPVLWFLKPNRKYIPGPLFVFWMLCYVNVILWLFSSPEPRFGLAFHTLSIGLPLLTLLEPIAVPVKKMQLLALASLWLISIAYGINIFRKPSTYPFNVRDCWLRPLKDYRYSQHNDKKTFPYRMLNNGVKLYIADSTHACLNGDIPCRPDTFLQVEMRGPRVEDGFRATHSDLKKIFDYIE